MAHEITRDELIKLAQDMVAASGLQSLYGISPFINAKNCFEQHLLDFEKQLRKTPAPPPGALVVDKQHPEIPDFLRFN